MSVHKKILPSHENGFRDPTRDKLLTMDGWMDDENRCPSLVKSADNDCSMGFHSPYFRVMLLC